MTARSSREVEVKLSVPDDAQVPDLTSIEDVDRVGETRSWNLAAVYYDTADLRLTRARVTLRRRTGGHDDGWHIKLPDEGQGRTEISVPLGESEEIPAEVLARVRAIVRQEPLTEIARVDNARTESHLLNTKGGLVAEFCDDHVTARRTHPDLPGTDAQWREWECELGPRLATTRHGEAILHSAVAVLEAAGASRAESPSKLLSALGNALEQIPGPPDPHLVSTTLGAKDVFAGVVLSLVDARDRLIAADPRVRDRTPGSVRAMLDAVHDISNVLSVFLEVFDHDSVTVGDATMREIRTLRTELKALSRTLNHARDRENICDHITELLTTEHRELIDERAAQQLTDDVHTRVRREADRTIAALDSERYIDCLDRLDRLLRNPPMPSKSERRKATALLVRAVKRSFLAFQKQYKAAISTLTDTDASFQSHLEHLRSLRRVIDRVRTSTRLVSSLTPYRIDKLAGAIADIDGHVQHAIATLGTRHLIVNKARHVTGRGEDTFAYGILFQREAQQETVAIAEIAAQYPKAKKAFKKFRRSVEQK